MLVTGRVIHMNSCYMKIVVMCPIQILSRRMKMKVKVDCDICVFRLELTSGIQKC
jgi:hypothetical protein